MILDTDFLKKTAARYGNKISYLVRLAREPEKYATDIAQINRLWDGTSPEMKTNEQLRSQLRSVKDSDFRGGLAELVTHFVLKKYSKDVLATPRIKHQTPDFYIATGIHSLIVETFCLGHSESEREEYDLIEMFRREVQGIKSNHSIHLVCPPIPAPNGTLHGLGKALNTFITNPIPPLKPRGRFDDEEPCYWIEAKNGAKVGFSIHTWDDEQESIYGGCTLGMRCGDTKINTLTDNLLEKLRKYDFPFIAAVVVDTDASLRTLLHTMIGREQVSIRVKTDKGPPQDDDVRWHHSDDGFWGKQNRRFQKNLNLQGILFLRLVYCDIGFRIRAHLLENPFIRIGLGQVFHDMPDVLRSPYDGDREEMPGLLLEP